MEAQRHRQPQIQHITSRDEHLTRCVSNPIGIPGVSERENRAAGAEAGKEKHGDPAWPSKAHWGFSWGSTLGQSSRCPVSNLTKINSVSFCVGTRGRARY